MVLTMYSSQVYITTLTATKSAEIAFFIYIVKRLKDAVAFKLLFEQQDSNEMFSIHSLAALDGTARWVY